MPWWSEEDQREKDGITRIENEKTETDRDTGEKNKKTETETREDI